MAGRKNSKQKRSVLEAASGLTRRAYANLKKLAETKREVIRTFKRRKDAGNYIIPDANEYTLKALVNRLSSGENIRTITAELKRITPEKIRHGTVGIITTKDKYRLTTTERKEIISALNSANKAIREAQKRFPDFVDVIPKEFDTKDFIGGLVSRESVLNKIQDLKLFTKENLTPTVYENTGEIITQAELEYNRRIIERENERRKLVRAMRDPKDPRNVGKGGFFPQQRDVDERDIEFDKIDSIETIRKRGETWDDPARVHRANLFVDNYVESIKTLEAKMIHAGVMNNDLRKKLNEIKKKASSLAYNEKLISFAAYRMPNIQIAIVSGVIYGEGIDDEGITAIYNQWMGIENMYKEQMEDFE